MAKRRRKKSKKRALKTFIWTIILCIITLIGYLYGPTLLGKDTPAPVSGDEVQFHFIDVGQGDATLIRTAAGDILIDAGTNDSEEALKAYLDKVGVDDIEYAIFTHPHEDHIGGADMVVKSYNVKNVILPGKVHTSKTYEYMMDAIEERGCEVTLATPDVSFTVGELKCSVLAPISKLYSELNDYSVVLRAEYGETVAIFTGDAEVHVEEEMLDRYRLSGKLDCDLLKVGHHGSDTSSSEAFISAASPAHAVISVGKGNTYGHPVQAILKRYENANAAIYRTDLEGSIVFKSTGGEPERVTQ